MDRPTRTATSRERLLTALQGGIPDRVPWLEIAVAEELLIELMGERKFYPPGEVCAALGLDACGVTYRPRISNPDQLSLASLKESYYRSSRQASYVFPQAIADVGLGVDGRLMVKQGLLRTPADLRLLEEYLPDPDDPRRYETLQNMLVKTRGDHANVLFVHVGTEDAMQSMGLDVAALAVYDDPQFLSDVLWRYAEWCARTVEHVNALDVDVIVVMNDHADNHGPWFSPDVFRELILPPIREVTRRIRKPWIYHSDGNIGLLIPDLLTLGMNALHPIQSNAMDLAKMKQEWGAKVALAAGLDLVYTMTRATPEEVDADVRSVISTGAPGGGFILSSVSLAEYCKPENVIAVRTALQKYGQYPLTV